VHFGYSEKAGSDTHPRSDSHPYAEQRQLRTSRGPGGGAGAARHGRVGKTQLAAEYAHRFAAAYDLAWWVNSEQGGLIGDEFAALGLALGCVQAAAGTQVVRAVVLAELRERGRWLLVFDNAENPADVTPWLPGRGGHVLITSRERGWAEVAAPVEVDVLARPESVAILQARVPGLTGADRSGEHTSELQ